MDWCVGAMFRILSYEECVAKFGEPLKNERWCRFDTPDHTSSVYFEEFNTILKVDTFDVNTKTLEYISDWGRTSINMEFVEKINIADCLRELLD